MVFPKTMTEHGHKLADDAVVCVKGRVDKREEAPQAHRHGDRGLRGHHRRRPAVAHPASRSTGSSEGLIDELKGLLGEHPGESQVFLHLGDRQVLRLPDEFCVDASGGLVGHSGAARARRHRVLNRREGPERRRSRPAELRAARIPLD